FLFALRAAHPPAQTPRRRQDGGARGGGIHSIHSRQPLSDERLLPPRHSQNLHELRLCTAALEPRTVAVERARLLDVDREPRASGALTRLVRRLGLARL